MSKIYHTKKFKITCVILTSFVVLFVSFFVYIRNSRTTISDIDFPFNQWIALESHFGEQSLIANENYIWEYANGKEYKFSAKPTEPLPFYINVFLTPKFLWQHNQKLVTYQIVNLNKKLSKESENSTYYHDIFLYRVRSDKFFHYEFYIYLANDEPEWILVCKEYCYQDDAITIKVKKTK